ncbi:MAG TPA: non-homologous end-joining DNA ligase [Actinomycetes bacterium]|nr:non-homologous end-joining DNA ligase [Actinomycetes bacterium]
MATGKRRPPPFPSALPARRVSPEARGAGSAWRVEAEGRELRLSNLNKVYWPGEGITKADLLAYYWNVAPLLLPHLADRPLTMHRMPDGLAGEPFYEKRVPAHAPSWLPTAAVPSEERSKITPFVVVQDLPSLLYVVNLGCIEMHPLHSRAGSLDRPDYAFFDLDPFEPYTFADVRFAAKLVKVVLDGLGLRGYPKTSGATGMQVFVPLDGTHTYADARAFVERVGRLLVRASPDKVTMDWAIEKRAGKVFVDHQMNRQGANVASAYSVRPRPGAPVSTPLDWDELDEDIEPGDFRIDSVWERFASGDRFGPVLTDRQSLAPAMEALGLGPPGRPRREHGRSAGPNTPRRPARAAGPAALDEYASKRDFARTPEPRGAAPDPEDPIPEAEDPMDPTLDLTPEAVDPTPEAEGAAPELVEAAPVPVAAPESEGAVPGPVEALPEPEGAAAGDAGAPPARVSPMPAEPHAAGIPAAARLEPGSCFTIQQHHARSLHHDVRFEHDGVLVSFAVPKRLPEEPGVRHLAVNTEDHPLDYLTFSGAIPAGEYGGGEVRLFDLGTYEPLEVRDGKWTVRLHGSRYHGAEYHFFRTKGRDWMCVLAGKASLPQPAPPPTFEPMMAALETAPFDAEGWQFEVKWDGHRCLANLGTATRLTSRTGRDATGQFPELAEMHRQLAARNAVIDGEVVALDAQGRPSFARMQDRFHRSAEELARNAGRVPIQFIAFDLLWLDGVPLLDRPLSERRARLAEVFVETRRMRLSQVVEEAGVAFFGEIEKLGLEGVVGKRMASPYRPGQRSPDWRKVKAVHRQDCVIVGWTPGKGMRSATLGALLLAVWDGGRLRYAGNVGTGFGQAFLAELLAELRERETTERPVDPDPRVRGARWVRPELVCEVEYQGWTKEGRLRFASFKGIRTDKLPEDCRPEPAFAGSAGGRE